MGELIREEDIVPEGGILSLDMDVSDLPEGLYFARLRQNGLTEIQPLLLKR
jgi:hypothetical protein